MKPENIRVQYRGRILGWNPDKIQDFSSLLFPVTSTALPWDFYLFFTQFTVFAVQLVYTVKEKEGKPG
jgi:hypothetical protein